MKKKFMGTVVLAGMCCLAGETVFKSTDSIIVRGNDVCAELAVKEFNALAGMSTGKCIGEGVDGKHKIYIGRGSEVEKRLGKAFLDELKDEESVVFEKDGDLFLVGGGDMGTLYAVYDFIEDNLGYRWYFERKNGEVIDKMDEVVFKGKATRKRPAFEGYRINHFNDTDTLFRLRHRDNVIPERFIPGYKYKFAGRIPGHGFMFFIPPFDPKKDQTYILKGIKGQFKDHPEYFTLGRDGKRCSGAQLCLSNPGTRRALTDAVLAYVKDRGKGVYMVGSNDNHNSRYCWCDECVALEKKYDSVGGPLWDYLLELCAELKARGLNDVYIKSLAYKGPKQTERAPKGIVFPDNFICDAAFLNCDRCLAEVPDMTLEDGTVFNRFENLKKWVAITSHVSYWFYGGNTVASVYSRMQKEFKELREAGVKSVGACRTGGGYAFGDMTLHLFYSMLCNPDMDVRGEVEKMMAIKYGPAAKFMLQYMDEMDAARQRAVDRDASGLDTDYPFRGFSFVMGKELVRWQQIFEDAQKVVSGNDEFARNVRFAKIGLDIQTVQYAHKIRSEVPDCKLDMAEIARKGNETAVEYRKNFQPRSKKNSAEMSFDMMANYANLKNDDLPAELQKYEKNKVHRVLPPKPGPHWKGKKTSVEDPGTICGYAIADVVPEKFDFSKGVIGVDFYDEVSTTYFMRNTKTVIPIEGFEKGKYKLCRIGVTKVSPRCKMVFGNMWESPINIGLLSRFYDPTYVSKEYEIWVSMKLEGPKFFKDATGESKIHIEQFFAVDMGVPESK